MTYYCGWVDILVDKPEKFFIHLSQQIAIHDQGAKWTIAEFDYLPKQGDTRDKDAVVSDLFAKDSVTSLELCQLMESIEKIQHLTIGLQVSVDSGQVEGHLEYERPARNLLVDHAPLADLLIGCLQEMNDEQLVEMDFSGVGFRVFAHELPNVLQSLSRSLSLELGSKLLPEPRVMKSSDILDTTRLISSGDSNGTSVSSKPCIELVAQASEFKIDLTVKDPKLAGHLISAVKMLDFCP